MIILLVVLVQILLVQYKSILGVNVNMTKKILADSSHDPKGYGVSSANFK